MNRYQAQQDINNTLENMVKSRPDGDWSPIHMEIEGTICGNKPVCAMVVAAYQSVGWDMVSHQIEVQ